MYELIQINENDYYIDCPTKIGVVKTGGNDVVFIDSGNDKDAAKKALKAIGEKGWTLKAVYATHAHADHIGGNRLLSERTGCRLYARGVESAYARFTGFNPSSLWGGLPVAELRHKFLLAQESDTMLLSEEVLPQGWKIIELPGHSPDMTGYLTPDGTAYIGDALIAAETVEKHGVFFLFDPGKTVESLEIIKNVPAKFFVPSHAAAADNVSALADLNREAILKLQRLIIDICAEPGTFEEILRSVFTEYGMLMTAQTYALTGSTVRSYISGLYSDGKLTYVFEDNRMLWKIPDVK